MSGPSTAGALGTVTDAIEAGIRADRSFSILGRSGVAERATHSEIWDEAGRMSSGLLNRGLGAGNRVGVVGSTTLGFVTACLSVWRAGLTLVPLPGRGGRAADEWARIVKERIDRCGARMLVGDGPADLSVPSATVDDLREESATTRSPSPSDIALIQFSSGTTSRPKGTVLSHETMMTRIGLRASGATGDQHHVLKWNPMHTGAMITSVVHHALARGDHVTVSPPRLFTSDMGRWLREISARGITQGGGPTFAYDLASRAIERGDVRDIDLTGWRSASAAGEVMDPSVLVRFAALAAPFGFEEDRFLTRYVSSEAGFVTDGRKGAGLRVASLDREQLASRCVKHVTGDQGTQVLSNGAAMPGVQIRIVNEEGDDVASDRIGEIWIRSPGLAAGYKEEPDLTAAAFGDGWYRSGDAGFLDDGELFITGRIKDMLIVRGANLYAEDIEAVVHAAVPSVTCCAFGVQGASSEEVVLTLESLEGKLAQHSVAEARTAVWRTMGISVLEVVEMAPGTTPRTDSGKLQRRVLKARYEAGALNGAGGSN